MTTFTDRDLVPSRKELVTNNQSNIILTTPESLEGFANHPYACSECNWMSLMYESVRDIKVLD